MNKIIWIFILIILFSFNKKNEESKSWIRINQLGYTPEGIKVAVWCSKNETSISSFSLIDSATGKTVFTNKAGKNFGAYGPFKNTYRLNFSSYKKAGAYFLKAGNTSLSILIIGEDVLPAFKK